jgi:uncharacterized protein (TIGR02996 family)
VTASLRYDIPLPLAKQIAAESPPLWADLGMVAVCRGGGGRRRLVATFALRLPRDRVLACRLTGVLWGMAGRGPKVSGPAHTLLKKLVAALGLPPCWPLSGWVGPGAAEAGFLKAIEAEPGDLASWSAYADWLQEQPYPGAALRGRVIAGWLSGKVMPCKAGIPLLAR